MSKIRIGENHYGEALHASAYSGDLWIEIDKPGVPDIYICVSSHADLEELAKLVAKALAELPDEEAH